MNSKWWSKIALAVLVAAGIGLRAEFFRISLERVPAFDDECKIAIQAHEIAHGKFPLLILASPYIFPLDAYLMAPTAPWLPRDALGARLMAFLQGLGAMAAGLLIVRLGGPWRAVWPGVALVLFPSAYLLMLQAGMALPGYPPLLFLGPLAIWFALRSEKSPRARSGNAWISGLLSGLISSGTMLALPFVLASGMAAAAQRTWKCFFLAITAFACGAVLGLAPHYAAKHIHSGAFDAVQQSVTPRDALGKLRSPVLDRTMAAALGIGTPIFADSREHLPSFAGHGPTIGLAWLAILLGATGWAVIRFFRNWKRDRVPDLDFDMPFIAISWMCLALFLGSARSHAHTYRYLAPAVLSFPIILAGLHAFTTRRVLRGAVAVVALFSLAGNAMNIRALMRHWDRPQFADELTCFDQTPVIRYLQSRGIAHAHATYTDAYRITYATGEKPGAILCGQPYNERFPGWMVPFKDAIDASTNVAFICSHAYKFPPEDFERDCALAGVKYRVETLGEYRVYTDFRRDAALAFARIPPEKIRAAAGDNPAEAGRLSDGKADTRWRARREQAAGMWVELDWTGPALVSGLEMEVTGYHADRALAVRLRARVGGEWRTVCDSVPKRLDPFEWKNNHPTYGRKTQTYPFLPVEADALRLEIIEPNPGRDWTIGDLSVLTPVPADKK